MSEYQIFVIGLMTILVVLSAFFANKKVSDKKYKKKKSFKNKLLEFLKTLTISVFTCIILAAVLYMIGSTDGFLFASLFQILL
jgi:hypothetical protein